MINFKDYFTSQIVFEKISDLAEILQAEVYVVGGFVRDLILSRVKKEIDFLVVGNGIEFVIGAKFKN